MIRSMLLTPADVRAHLAGRTETRVVVKPPITGPSKFFSWHSAGYAVLSLEVTPGIGFLVHRTPPYQVGDLVWGRETFTLESGVDDMLPDIRPDRPHFEVEYDENGDGYRDRLIPHYRATDPEPELCYEEEDRPGCKRCEDGEPHCHWRSSTQMPQWASRIWFEITNVAVEKDGETWVWVLDHKEAERP